MRTIHLLSICAATSLLLLTACSKNEQVADRSGTDGLVTFTAELPEGLQTASGMRAYGDGTTATELTYAVYDAGQTTPLIVSEGDVTFTNRKATVSLRLTKGKNYDILFWAAKADNNYYTFDAATQEITVNYTNAAGNDEGRDAFFWAEKNLAISDTPVKKDIKLSRPFAQLNVGTIDYAEAAATGFTPTQSTVTVKQVYTKLNLATGAVSTPADVTFVKSDIPAATERFPLELDARYLAMDYLLVGTDKSLVEVNFTVTNGTKNFSKTVTNVPVQRNYRTNIYGNLLTGTGELNVEIMPAFADPDFFTPDYTVVTTDELMKTALHQDIPEINIKVQGTVNIASYMPYNNSEDSWGGASTLRVNIVGADENAKITTTSVFDICAVNTKNPNAIITIQNITMVNNRNGGTWNSYDWCFKPETHCENVKFGSAVACDGTGNSYSFTNCTFTDHVAGMYLMWIRPGTNVTISGCDFNNTLSDGRAIKIDDQYVTTPAKTTLAVKDTKFVSQNKSAILVKNKGGADITYSNVDITGVVKDKTHVVWIDDGATTTAGYTGAITVNGNPYTYVEP